MKNTKQIDYLISNSFISLVDDGKPYSIASTNPSYKGIVEAIKVQDWNKVRELADLATAVKKYVSQTVSDVEVRGNGVYYKGEQLGGPVVDKILEFMSDGLPTEPLIAFVGNIMKNPSRGSRERLYSFLENHKVVLTPRGTFLTYKAVNKDYTSITAGRGTTVEVSTDEGKTWTKHTGHVPNNVGNLVRIERGDVDDNPSNHCSHGLHCGALSYVQDFGGSNSNKVIVEVNPADVVSVPTDHNCAKIRVAFYKVVSDLKTELTTLLVDNSDTPYSDDDESYVEDNYDEDYDGYNY